MRITKSLNADQEIIMQFLDIFGGGAVALSGNKYARPGFFIFAHTFIREYIEGGFFKKEEFLIKALENCGFPLDDGPIGAMRAEQQKSREAAELLINAAKGWQAGDEEARVEVGWATSEYTSAMRQHLERLKNLIFPLLEQNLSRDDEHEVAEGINKVLFEGALKDDPERYNKLLDSLEEELSDWR